MWDVADVVCAGASLELLVRNAVNFGELSPGAEREIVRLTQGRSLSERETKLLALLQDAIAASAIQQCSCSNINCGVNHSGISLSAACA
ncbi:MAG: hypothetical protein HC886_12235 [Leptolyngbyaceae cyanobacterium SM1_1_3]|nr:hypothetical protein [Leptolyngbyaceae cyanobacterium SM1_1_3]NJN02214.1 hypothetical protein [Leptolyngbyaceae cyanobacterium RM1_1_2]NJO10361.1 hypothetical protein [Leptolyngbyaceae cyanobacterium SL_1_1]